MASATDTLLEDIKDAGIKRIKSPFYFSLIVAFAVTNWKSLYILLLPAGELDAQQRLEAIKHLYESPYYILYITKVFLMPIGFACLYVTYLPRWLFKLDLFREKDIVKQRNEIKEVHGGLQETQRMIGELTIERGRLMKQLDEEITARRQSETDLIGARNDVVNKEKKMSELRQFYHNTIANVVLAHDGWRNTFIHIRGSAINKEQNKSTEVLSSTLGLIRMTKTGYWTLTDEGKAVAEFIA